jgi:hypothetical protein
VPSSASASDNRGKAPDASEWFAESGSEFSVEGDEEVSSVLSLNYF